MLPPLEAQTHACAPPMPASAVAIRVSRSVATPTWIRIRSVRSVISDHASTDQKPAHRIWSELDRDTPLHAHAHRTAVPGHEPARRPRPNVHVDAPAVVADRPDPCVLSSHRPHDRVESLNGHCQLGANGALLSLRGRAASLKLADARHRIPFDKRPRPKQAVVNRAQQMAAYSAEILDDAMDGREALQMGG